VVLDRQIWFADFFLIAGLWIMLASALVMLYSVAGTVFCGWVCPQNILSEWANFVTRKFLGRRAKVNMDGSAPLVATTKDKALNWICCWACRCSRPRSSSAIVPLFYFYPPATVWSFVTWRADPRLAGSLHYIYFVFVLIILLDVAFIRHFWCRFACVYRVWQHSFRTRETLHVSYDASRADELHQMQLLRERLFHRNRSAQDCRLRQLHQLRRMRRCLQSHAQQIGTAGSAALRIRRVAAEGARALAIPRQCDQTRGAQQVDAGARRVRRRLFVWGLHTGSRCMSSFTAPMCSTSRIIATTASRSRTSSTTRDGAVRVTGLAPRITAWAQRNSTCRRRA
jgi:hypothetical protein